MGSQNAEYSDQDRFSERSTFDEFGVLHFSQILPPADVRLIHSQIEDYITHIAPGLRDSFVVYEPNSARVRNLYWMNTHSRFFASLGDDERLRGRVASLVDWTPEVHYVELFAKPAKVGTRIPLHQDEPFLCLEPPEFVTLWIAIDRATHLNGGVHYYPRSHKLGELAHAYTDVKGSLLTIAEPEVFDGMQTVCFELQSGDAVVHHGKIVHYSNPNHSDSDRVGLSIAYKSTRAIMNQGRSLDLFGFSWKDK